MPNESEETEVDVNTETYENDSEGESDVAEAEATEHTDTPKQSKEERERGIYARLHKKYGDKPDEGKESSKEDAPKGIETLQERLDRQELKIAGITDKKEQVETLKLAKQLGLDIEDAVVHPAVKAVLKDMRNKAATPAPSSRTSNGQRDEVAYWAAQASKGTLAPTAELRKKVREYLATNK